MHVLILSEIYPPDLGGGATRAFNVAKGLAANGVKVTVIAGFPHYPSGNVPKSYRHRALVFERMNRIDVIRTYVPPLASKGLVRRFVLFFCFMLSSLFPIAFLDGVDGVFASNPQVLVAFPALVYRTRFRCRMILNVDDLWPESLYDLGMLNSGLLQRVAESVARLAYGLSNYMAPISPAYVDVISHKYDVSTSKLVVIPGGVDLALFRGGRTSKNRQETVSVLYIGAFSSAYDFGQVLRAAELLRGHRDITFTLRGDGERAEQIDSEIAGRRLSNVRMVREVVSRAQAARLMCDADILIQPLAGLGDTEKGISSKLYEYQAAGKPIVVCSRGMPGLFVSQSQSGLVVAPGDADALASAILTIAQDPSLAARYGQSGRGYVEKNADLKGAGMPSC